METMHAAGRRRLPPVPRPAGDRTSAGQLATDEQDADQFTTQVIDTGQPAAELIEAELAALTEAGAHTTTPDITTPTPDEPADDTAQLEFAELAALLADDEATAEVPADEHVEIDDEDAVDDVPPAAQLAVEEQDPAQQFVARLRSSATDFAAAAGAESAVIREAVPPARHRRARCRLVLRYTDGDLVDVTLLGPAGAPGRPSRHGFDRQIQRWLGAGLVHDDAWTVVDPDAPDGAAVDLTAWVAAG